MTFPELVAHRGYTLHYPENTRIGIEAAIASGARFVEVDVQLSQDGVPILFHDRDLMRVCGVQGAVHDYGFATLQTFAASEFDRFGYKYRQTPLASLRDLRAVLERHPHVHAFIEAKRNSIERFGIDAVLDAISACMAPLAARCILISFSIPLLTQARLRTDNRGWSALGAVVDRWRERRAARIRALEPEYIFCDVDGLPRWGRLQMGATRIVIYEVAQATRACALHARGAHMIETFACGELRDALARGLR